MDPTKFTQLSMAIGKVLRKPFANRLRVSVQLNRFNSKLLMYFPENSALDVYDPKDQCKAGDIVLLRKIENPVIANETHKIEEVIYPVGCIVDPITGLRVGKNGYLFNETPLSAEKLCELHESIKDREYSPKYSYEISEGLFVKEETYLDSYEPPTKL